MIPENNKREKSTFRLELLGTQSLHAASLGRLEFFECISDEPSLRFTAFDRMAGDASAPMRWANFTVNQPHRSNVQPIETNAKASGQKLNGMTIGNAVNRLPDGLGLG